MTDEDRERWDRRYAAQGLGDGEPSAALVELAPWLPRRGRALDLAGGRGENARWLDAQGLAVTLTDLSEVALDLARRLFERSGASIERRRVDLEREPLPPGPWELVLCCSYLQRELVPAVAAALAPGGRFVWIHPTTTNLQRHPRPGSRFLLEPGEAERLVRAAGLRPCWSQEAWVGRGDDARFLARVIAERPRALARAQEVAEEHRGHGPDLRWRVASAGPLTR